MSRLGFSVGAPNLASVFSHLPVRGVFYSSGGVVVSEQSLPTDPVGNTTVTFDGVIAGTEIHVYLPDLTELAGVESCVEQQQLTWPVYVTGSPNNTVYITMIKRGLRPQKFDFHSHVGSQTLPIFPQPDLAYKNPT